MSEQTVNFYLSEVLGLRDVNVAMHPTLGKEIGSPVETEVIDDVSSRMVILTPYLLSSEEAEMVKKMLASIGLDTAHYLNVKDHTVEAVKTELQNFFSIQMIAYGVESSSFHEAFRGKAEIVDLPAISQFLDNSSPQKLQAIKKEAWECLKVLKGKLKS